MEKFYIRYHIIGNNLVTDVREFESFEEAITRISKGLKNEVIGIKKKDDHVIEVKTKHITHHEVMSEDIATKYRNLNHLSNLVESSFKKN